MRRKIKSPCKWGFFIGHCMGRGHTCHEKEEKQNPLAAGHLFRGCGQPQNRAWSVSLPWTVNHRLTPAAQPTDRWCDMFSRPSPASPGRHNRKPERCVSLPCHGQQKCPGSAGHLFLFGAFPRQCLTLACICNANAWSVHMFCM